MVEISREALASLLALFDVMQNQIGTVDIEVDGYSGISYADLFLIDDAVEAVEAHLSEIEKGLA